MKSRTPKLQPPGPTKAVPQGPRVFRRPSLPISQQAPFLPDGDCGRLPTEPKPERERQSEKNNASESKMGMTRRLAWLVLPTVAALGLLAAGVWMMPAGSDLQNASISPEIEERLAANGNGTEKTTPRQIAATEAAIINSFDDMLTDSFLNEAEQASATEPLTGPQLLASRFYELEVDGQGNVVAARMPAGDQRFGPAADEVAALLDLPHLERLDLGNTLASVAVPVANRHPQLKVLILRDQNDVAALRRLNASKQLLLIDSEIDTAELSSAGIDLVQPVGA